MGNATKRVFYYTLRGKRDNDVQFRHGEVEARTGLFSVPLNYYYYYYLLKQKALK
jgi:hypothetical protein